MLVATFVGLVVKCHLQMPALISSTVAHAISTTLFHASAHL